MCVSSSSIRLGFLENPLRPYPNIWTPPLPHPLTTIKHAYTSHTSFRFTLVQEDSITVHDSGDWNLFMLLLILTGRSSRTQNLLIHNATLKHLYPLCCRPYVRSARIVRDFRLCIYIRASTVRGNWHTCHITVLIFCCNGDLSIVLGPWTLFLLFANLPGTKRLYEIWLFFVLISILDSMYVILTFLMEFNGMSKGANPHDYGAPWLWSFIIGIIINRIIDLHDSKYRAPKIGLWSSLINYSSMIAICTDRNCHVMMKIQNIKSNSTTFATKPNVEQLSIMKTINIDDLDGILFCLNLRLVCSSLKVCNTNIYFSDDGVLNSLRADDAFMRQ